jgi:tellurite resistance protein
MKLHDYFKKYQVQRATFLNEEQFASVLLMFPAMLVGLADGVLDADEKQNIANAIIDGVDEDIIVALEIYSELIYLIFADTQTQNEALECLKELVVEDAEMKSAVADIMTAMADASDGVSVAEEKKITELKTFLSIA